MKEDFLHFIWRFKRFDIHKLSTTSAETLQILNFGIWNHNAGPDFLNASVWIGDTLWHGHIEIHIRSSDWLKHKHDKDPMYNNVILHVVYIHDRELRTRHERLIPTLELHGRIHPSVLKNYSALKSSRSQIPCQASLAFVDRSLISLYQQSLLISRLSRKYSDILKLLNKHTGDWEQVCYTLISKYICSRPNSDSLLELSIRLKYQTISRHRSSLFQLEALLLGVAGLLQPTIDDYSDQLLKEYAHLGTKYNLNTMTKEMWNFGKIRPGNLPTIRIAQLAAIIHKNNKIFGQLISHPDLNSFKEILTIKASVYWNHHFIPGKPSLCREKTLGKKTIDQIIINAFIPIIFSYAKIHTNEDLIDHCITIYSQIAAENNAIIHKWQSIGINCSNAGESQALIELKTQYCEQLKCLNCQIGTKLLFK